MLEYDKCHKKYMFLKNLILLAFTQQGKPIQNAFVNHCYGNIKKDH